MLAHYLKTIFRQLLTNKAFSGINIAGLTLGTFCCLYLLIYVNEQYRYDTHHDRASDIYRVTSFFESEGDKSSLMATTSPPTAPAMKNEFSEIEEYTRLVSPPGTREHLLRYGDKSFVETEGMYADSTFFDVFSYHFRYGSSAQALKQPYTLVLSAATAEKLFGTEDPIHKVIELENTYGKHAYTVTGVVDNDLGKTHISARFFISMNSGGIGEFVRSDQTWVGNNFVSSYVKLRKHTDAPALEAKLPAFVNRFAGDLLRQQHRRKSLHLQPVGSIHTSPEYTAGGDGTVSPKFLTILLVIGALIQFAACINFMNLATARSAKRAKEVGIRKVAGALKSDLVKQFLGESVLLSVLAVTLALPLLALCLPYLNQLAGTDITLSFFRQRQTWMLVLGVVLLTGVLAGSYPAFYLSGFNITRIIKGNFTSNVSAANIRKGLVITQFVVSVVLITGILVINRQLRFMTGKDLGYAREQRVVINFSTSGARQQIPAFRSEISKLSGVRSVTNANNYPSQFIFNDMLSHTPGQPMDEARDVQMMFVNSGFIHTLGLTLLSGSDFQPSDRGKVIVNEATLRELGIRPEKAVGTPLIGTSDTLEIAGVIRDFNVASLREPIRPFALAYSPYDGELPYVIVATRSADYPTLLRQLEKQWHSLVPDAPFQYTFLDEQVANQYASERTLLRITNAFTGMAIFISCLGLLGLSAFTAEKRARELSIRKILGASARSLATLLSKEFAGLVVVASVIAFPIAWYGMHSWLEGFAYRIELSWWMFVMAGASALVIALLTVSFQSIKSALANPTKALRS